MKSAKVFTLLAMFSLVASLFLPLTSVFAATDTLLPTAYVTTSGGSGGQPVSNLHVQDQSGTQDDWNKYVEFTTPGNQTYAGYRQYTLPAGINTANITGIQITANYRGPIKSYQTWTWTIYNWNSSSWVTLGDNATAQSWVWTVFTFDAAGTFADYVKSDTREIRIRLESNNNKDNALLDYEAVTVTHSGGATSTPTNMPVPATATHTNTPVALTPTNTSAPATATHTNTPTASVTSYEAEASGNTLAGGAVVETCSTCSGGNLVGWVGNNAGTLQFNSINAATAGNYTLTIYYINGDSGVRSATLSVNGGAGTSMSYPATGSWTTVGSIQTTVALNAGSNTLKFSNPVVGSWAPDYDRVTVNTGTGPTNTPAPATSTPTSIPPTATFTSTATLAGPTATFTPTSIPPTATPTNTPQPGVCNRFVATNGNDSNDGLTINTAWRTVQKAANSAQPGNIVCARGGTYNEKVTVNVSGLAGAYITFQSYPGETAILDGTGITVPSADNGMIYIQNRSYVIVKGFHIRNYKTSTKNNVPIGVRLTGTSNHIEIRNNTIYNIEHNGTAKSGTDAHGIAIHGTSGTSALNNIIIDNNELYNLKLGSSEALVINGNVDGWQVTNNSVHDVNNIGIDAIGFEGTAPSNDQARNGLIAYNDVYNITSAGNPAYGNDRSAGCIYVDGGRDIIIEYNKAHNCNIGIEIASEHAGKATSNVTIRNNFVYGNTDAGIAMGGYDTRRGSTENCVIVNNTLYNNAVISGAWGAELYIQYDTRNNTIKNNIFFAKSGMPYILSWSAVMTNNVMNYNLFYNGASWQWKNVSYSTFAAYQSGSGNDANSLNNLNPLFVDAASGNLHLQNSSPAIDAGQNLAASGLYDIDGETRIQNIIDIGADEVR